MGVEIASQPGWPEIEAATGLGPEALRAGLEGRPHLAAWVAGSLVEGLGTPNSDVDVFVLVPGHGGGATRVNDDYRVEVRFAADRRVDYEMWSLDTVDAMAAKFAALPLEDPESNVCDALSEHEVLFMTRLHLSLPLAAEPEVEALRARFSRDRLVSYLVENRRHYVDDAFDDTVGFCLAGDFASAALRARDTAEFAVDLLLHDRGLLNVRHKYRRAIFDRARASWPDLGPAYDRYWALSSGIPSTAAGQQDFVARALDFVERIVTHVQDRRAAS
jgi:hypothetical protein